MQLGAGAAPALGRAPLEMFLRGRLFSAPLEVLSVEGDEAVNDLYRFQVRFTVDARDDIATDRTLLHMPAEVALGVGAHERHVHGIVTSLSAEAGQIGHRSIHRLTIEPRACLLRRRRHSRVFQDQNVVDVVTTLLREHRVLFRLRLVNVYEKRAYMVQHHESDWDFAQRLLAEAGVFFFFDHPISAGNAVETGMGDAEVLVLCDTAQYYPPLVGSRELALRPQAATQGASSTDDGSALDFVLRNEAATTVRLIPRIRLHPTAG